MRVQEVFLHCGKALKRSRLWDPSQHADRAAFPSIARVILEQTSEAGQTPSEAVVTAGDAFVEEDYAKNMY